MKQKFKLLSLLGILCLTGGALSFNNDKSSINSAIAESDVDWANWTLTTLVDNYQIDLPQDKTMASLVVDSGTKGMFYASGTTVIDDKSDTGYLNDHRPFFGDGTNNLIDYVTINGRTVSEIIDENAATNKYKDGTANWVFGLGGQYAPITLEANHEKLYIKIMAEYLQDIGATMHDIYVGFKAGAPLRDSNYVVHTLDKDISAVTTSNNVEASHFAEVKTTNSGTGLLYVKDTRLSNVNRGMKTTIFMLTRKLSEYAGQWILDHRLQLSAFVTINGKSIQEWNGSIDDSSWDYSNCVLAGGSDPSVHFNRPISINVNNGDNRALFISFHENFLAMFKEGEQVTLGVKKGFSYLCDGVMYYQDQDTANAFIYHKNEAVFFTALRPNVETLAGDASYRDVQVISISEKTTRNYRNEGYYGVNIKFNKSFDKFTEFDLSDGNDSLMGNRYAGQFVTVNGTTVEEINEMVDDSGYDYSTSFPHNISSGFYAKPILLSKSAPDTFTLIFHGDYIATLGDSITVGVTKGLTIYNAVQTNAATHFFSIDGVFQVSESASATVAIELNPDAQIKLMETKWMLSYDYSSENEQYTYSNIQISFGALVEKEIIDSLTAEYSVTEVGVEMHVYKNGVDVHSNAFNKNIVSNDFSSLRTNDKSKTDADGDYYSWYGMFTMLNKNAESNQSWLVDYKFQAQAYILTSNGDTIYLQKSEQVSISDLAYKYVQSGVTTPSVVALAKLGHPEVNA